MELLSIPKELKEEFVLIKATTDDASVSELIFLLGPDIQKHTCSTYILLSRWSVYIR